MSDNVTFDNLRASIMAAAKQHGDADDVLHCQKVLNASARFLFGAGATTTTVAALESLGGDTIPRINKVDVNRLGDDKIVALVMECGVPSSRVAQTAFDIARIMQYGVDRAAIYTPAKVDANDLSGVSVVGRNAFGRIEADNIAATESFGVNIDSLQQDNRLNIVLTLLRAFDSIIDKVLPRVSQENATITVKIPQTQVYDLSKSNDPSAAVRYGAANLIPLVQLYRNPSPVNTAAKNILVNTANDLTPSVIDQNNGNAILVGARVNMFDLSRIPGVMGKDHIDFSDLVADGGRIDFLIVNAVHTDTATTTEQFNIPTGWLSQAVFTKPANNLDSGDEITNIKTGTMLRAGSKTTTGTSTILATYTDAVIQLDVTFNADLNLKTSELFGSGHVRATLKPVAGKTDADISAATKADFAKLSFSIYSFQPCLQFNEENLRTTTTAVRVNRSSVQYNIPMARNVVAEYSLTQVTDADVTQSINVVNMLGNTDRGLGIIESRLSDIAAANAFASANPEYASIVAPTKLSIAASICLPIALQQTLNFNDTNTLSMREAERLSDMHGRLRETLLSVLTQVCAEALYENCLDGSEEVVFKVITYSKIANMVFSIKDYHANLDDEVAKEGRADFSMRLPNGYRIDVIKTNFDSFRNKALIIPVRAAAPTDPTSFGTIRDCGSYVAGYNHINANGVESRTVTNTREIVFPTNPIGAILTINGIDDLLKISLNSTVTSTAAATDSAINSATGSFANAPSVN